MNNRRLSIYEYFQKLQLEFVVAELRSKIYFRPQDKEYWQSVMAKKRKNIEDIVSKNNLPSIFDDKDVKRQYENDVFLDSEKYFPSFNYRDEEQKRKIEIWDHINYYSLGSQFRCVIENEIIVGKIIYYEAFAKNIKIETESGEQKYVKVENCRRIF